MSVNRKNYLRSLKQFWEVNDFTFSLDDIDTLTRKCGLIPEKFIVLSKEKRLASGYIRVNSHKC
jgi:hypothetical protein